MKNLREQSACGNCVHCLTKTPYDDSTEYYCTVEDKPPEAGKRPSYEDFGPGWVYSPEMMRWHHIQELVYEWEKTHLVTSWFVCDLWKGELK